MTILLVGNAARGDTGSEGTGRKHGQGMPIHSIQNAPHVLMENAVMGLYSKAPPTPAGGTPPPQQPPPITQYVGPAGAGYPGPKPTHGPAIPQPVRVGGSFYG